MRAFYNELDPYPAQWLRNLIAAKQLVDGDVDERSISDLGPEDVGGYVQAHFFAGIGGWPLALALAGWSGPVWTGSCPCQPFSAAGKRKGVRDSRDLWPAFRDLIAQCRPPTIFGEQVASADGRWWLARVRTDLEALGYAVGVADLCAASVGAPHIRQRLFWVGHSNSAGCKGSNLLQQGRLSSWRSGQSSGLAYSESSRRTQRIPRHDLDAAWQSVARCGAMDGGLGNADDTRSQGYWQPRERTDQRSAWAASGSSGVENTNGGRCRRIGDGAESPWIQGALIPCLDGKARRIGSGIQPLANGVPARVGQLRAYGNAIVPQVAAEFIQAYLEARQ